MPRGGRRDTHHSDNITVPAQRQDNARPQGKVNRQLFPELSEGLYRDVIDARHVLAGLDTADLRGACTADNAHAADLVAQGEPKS